MNNESREIRVCFEEIEEILGYRFVDRKYLEVAFTHSTYANRFGGKNNERLEFLGDAVLQLVVTETLFERSDANEGELTELRKQYVSKPALESAERRMGLMRYLRYSGGKINVAGKTSSNLFEAVVGAIYLDGGLDEARKFLRRHLAEAERDNYKTVLQEYVQERCKDVPCYHAEQTENGFKCTVSALGMSASGMGTSKKAAETEAARKLYNKFTKRDNH